MSTGIDRVVGRGDLREPGRRKALGLAASLVLGAAAGSGGVIAARTALSGAASSGKGRPAVYFNSAGSVTALAIATGQMWWSRQLGTLDLIDPVLAGDSCYVVCSGGQAVSALDASTGQTRWRRRIPVPGSATSSDLQVLGNLAYVMSSDENTMYVVAFDTTTGVVRWHRQLWGQGGTPYLLAAYGVVVASSAPGTYLLDARTGATRWQNDIASIGDDPVNTTRYGFLMELRNANAEYDALLDPVTLQARLLPQVGGFLAAAGDTLYASTASPASYLNIPAEAIDLRTLRVRWVHSPANAQVQCITAAGDLVFLAYSNYPHNSHLANTAVAARHARSGTLVWEREFLATNIQFFTVSGERLLMAGDYNDVVSSVSGTGWLACADGATGQTQWIASLEGGDPAKPVVAGDLALTATANVIYALHLSNGRTRWLHPLTGQCSTLITG